MYPIFGENITFDKKIQKSHSKLNNSFKETSLFNLLKYRNKLLEYRDQHELLLEKELIYNEILFLPQVIIYPNIVDFLLPNKLVIIEINSFFHSCGSVIKYDNIRTVCLESFGFNILRYNKEFIDSNLPDIINEIDNFPSSYRNFNYTVRILNLLDCNRRKEAHTIANKFVSLI